MHRIPSIPVDLIPDNQFRSLKLGRVNIDLSPYIRTHFKYLSRYSLEACAKHFLHKTEKTDLRDHYQANKSTIQLTKPGSERNPYHVMFEYEQLNRSDLRKVVAEYCAQDCQVTHELAICHNVVPKLLQLSSRECMSWWDVTQQILYKKEEKELKLYPPPPPSSSSSAAAPSPIQRSSSSSS
jgi:DNA polymerase elongation subunit (family B)